MRGWVCRLQLLLALASAVILGPRPAGLMTTFYCLRYETPPTRRARSPYLHPPGTGWPGYTPKHWVASYDSQGYSGGIRCRWNVFIEPLPRNGSTRYNIMSWKGSERKRSWRNRDSILAFVHGHRKITGYLRIADVPVEIRTVASTLTCSVRIVAGGLLHPWALWTSGGTSSCSVSLYRPLAIWKPSSPVVRFVLSAEFNLETRLLSVDYTIRSNIPSQR
jgi:hypothetical protein